MTTEPVFTRENPIELQCPICQRVWVPSMFDDYCLPACGCYGEEATRDTPCEPCGISHAWNCPNLPGRQELPTTREPQFIEVWPDGTKVLRGKVEDVDA
jgi:hypothetical protein